MQVIKKEKNTVEIVVLLVIMFALFVSLVLMYENKIDELETKIHELEVCNDK